MEAWCKTSKGTAPKKWAQGPKINKNNPKFEIDQPVMVKNHACHTFEPKYLLDYIVPKIPNDSTPLLIMPERKGRKTNIYYVKVQLSF